MTSKSKTDCREEPPPDTVVPVCAAMLVQSSNQKAEEQPAEMPAVLLHSVGAALCSATSATPCSAGDCKQLLIPVYNVVADAITDNHS